MWTYGAHFYASRDTYMGMSMCSCASVASVEISDGLLRYPHEQKNLESGDSSLLLGATRFHFEGREWRDWLRCVHHPAQWSRAWRKYVRAKGKLTLGTLTAARASNVDHVDMRCVLVVA